MALTNLRNGGSGTGPQCWTAADGSIYVVIIDLDWGAHVHKLPAGLADEPANWESFDLETISGNPLGLPIDSGDSHYRLAIAVDGQGYIHIAGNSHASPFDESNHRYVRSAQPNSILDGWISGGSLIDFSPSTPSSKPWLGVYDQFRPLADGTLLWTRSNKDVDTEPGGALGRDHIMYVLRPNATTWVPWWGTGELAVCDEIEDNGDPERAYITSITVRDGVVMLCGAWQWQHDDQDTRLNPYVILCRNMLESLDANTEPTWETVSGQVVSMPVTYSITSAATNCEIPDPTAISLVFGSADMDVNGYPYIMIGTYIGQNLHYWDGSAWQKQAESYLGSVVRIRDGMWKYVARADGHITLQPVNGSTTLRRGSSAPATYQAIPDPTQTDQGIYKFCLPDGDTPQLVILGDSPAVFKDLAP